jgi:hypothetical protein
MSQHDFNIANQTFPATRADINDAILAVVSNSSGDAEPSTTYANQWWYETDTNTLKIRNEANDGWVDVITLDASMTAAASELNQLDAITRGSILYGNASGETARLAAGGAGTVLSSDGTDLSWAAATPTLTRGQIIYSNASGTTAALAPGTAGQVLTSDGTDISYDDPAGGSTTLGDVGTYAFLARTSTASGSTISVGSSYSGSSLTYAGVSRSGGNNIIIAPSGSPSGTWRAMGHVGSAFTGFNQRATSFVRIS